MSDPLTIHNMKHVPQAIFPAVQEGLSIGRAWGPSVSEAHYRGGFEFTGTLRVVELRTDPSRQLALPDRG